MDYRDGAELYHFNQDQDEMLVELMRPDYYPLFAELLGDTVGAVSYTHLTLPTKLEV